MNFCNEIWHFETEFVGLSKMASANFYMYTVKNGFWDLHGAKFVQETSLWIFCDQSLVLGHEFSEGKVSKSGYDFLLE